MNIRFESSELETSQYLGEGEHECAITKIEAQTSKAGNPMIQLEFRAASGKTTRDWFPTSGNKFKLGGLAVAAGVPKEVLLAGGFTTESLAGKYVKVVRQITGKNTEGKNQYENSYLASANAKPSTSGSEEIPF